MLTIIVSERLPSFNMLKKCEAHLLSCLRWTYLDAILENTLQNDTGIGRKVDTIRKNTVSISLGEALTARR